ncbi:MAG: AI-2E family transporter [Candidatus Kryptoniota bacterium]
MMNIFKKSQFKVGLLLAFLFGFLWIVSLFTEVFALLLLSTLLSFLLSPLVGALERRGLPRVVSIVIIYLAIALFFILLFRAFLPALVLQVTTMEQSVRATDFAAKFQLIQIEVQKMLPFLKLDQITNKIEQFGVSITGESLSLITSAASVIMTAVIVPFVTFFFLKDGDKMVRLFIEHIPNKYFEMSLNVLHKIEIQLGKYIRAWMTEAAIVGALSITGLLVIGVNYAVLVGVLAGIANLIPYLGPLVGAVPAILISIAQRGDLSLIVPIVALFVGIRLADDVIIVPALYSRSASMHPLTIIFVLLVAAELKGIVGMVLAIPTYTIFKVIARETYWGLESYGIPKHGESRATSSVTIPSGTQKAANPMQPL